MTLKCIHSLSPLETTRLLPACVKCDLSPYTSGALGGPRHLLNILFLKPVLIKSTRALSALLTQSSKESQPAKETSGQPSMLDSLSHPQPSGRRLEAQSPAQLRLLIWARSQQWSFPGDGLSKDTAVSICQTLLKSCSKEEFQKYSNTHMYDGRRHKRSEDHSGTLLCSKQATLWVLSSSQGYFSPIIDFY